MIQPKQSFPYRTLKHKERQVAYISTSKLASNSMTGFVKKHRDQFKGSQKKCPPQLHIKKAQTLNQIITSQQTLKSNTLLTRLHDKPFGSKKKVQVL